MNFLKNILTPPVFEDEFKTQQAHLLHIILWTLACVPIPYLIYSVIAVPEDLARPVVQSLYGIGINTMLIFLLRRGYVFGVSVAQVSTFWIFFAATSLSGRGVQGEAYLIGNTLVITIAGILLGGSGAFVLTFLSLGLGLFMAIMQIQGSLGGDLISSPMTTWFISLILFPVGAILQHLSSGLIRSSLARARASEERYRLISQVSSDYTFSTTVEDDGSMHLGWVAGAFEEITGYTYKEYVENGGWRAHLHPEDVEKDDRDMELIRANQRVTTEIRTYTRQGQLRWVRVYGHPVWHPEEDRLIGIVGGVQDITDRKQAEEEREALIRELEAKNVELEQFTYTVSHDLKSPLVTIMGFLGFLERDAAGGDYERVRSSLRRIADAARKMQKLLNDLLELSRIGRLINSPENVSFAEIVNEALDRVRGQLDENHVTVEIQNDLPTVFCDRIRLVEVMQNLLENAAKYAAPGVEPRIEIGVNGINEKGFPILYVRDNGIGIEPEHHESIFGLFNKLDAQSEGTGIGLSLVKRIIEVHDGQIWVESAKGRGAAFFFSLPVRQTKEQPCADVSH